MRLNTQRPRGRRFEAWGAMQGARLRLWLGVGQIPQAKSSATRIPEQDNRRRVAGVVRVPVANPRAFRHLAIQTLPPGAWVRVCFLYAHTERCELSATPIPDGQIIASPNSHLAIHITSDSPSRFTLFARDLSRRFFRRAIYSAKLSKNTRQIRSSCARGITQVPSACTIGL